MPFNRVAGTGIGPAGRRGPIYVQEAYASLAVTDPLLAAVLAGLYDLVFAWGAGDVLI